MELQTRNGMIRGYESSILGKRVRSFLNVPFAEPPTGDNRFRPPIMKQPWKNIIDATVLAPACYQVDFSLSKCFLQAVQKCIARTPSLTALTRFYLSIQMIIS